MRNYGILALTCGVAIGLILFAAYIRSLGWE